jgi:hypothetical protein
MEALAAISAVVDFVGYIVEGLFGWRYLLSPSYRTKVRARWKHQPRIVVLCDVVGLGASALFVAALGAWAVWTLWRG